MKKIELDLNPKVNQLILAPIFRPEWVYIPPVMLSALIVERAWLMDTSTKM